MGRGGVGGGGSSRKALHPILRRLWNSAAFMFRVCVFSGLFVFGFVFMVFFFFFFKALTRPRCRGSVWRRSSSSLRCIPPHPAASRRIPGLGGAGRVPQRRAASPVSPRRRRARPGAGGAPGTDRPGGCAGNLSSPAPEEAGGQRACHQY